MIKNKIKIKIKKEAQTAFGDIQERKATCELSLNEVNKQNNLQDYIEAFERLMINFGFEEKEIFDQLCLYIDSHEYNE